MGDYNNFGKIMIYIGLLIVAMGSLIYFTGGWFSWLGHLPGDIRIEKEHFRFYFPITTMIVISIILNLIIRLIRFFLH